MIKYYIFGGNKYTIKQSGKKALYRTTNLDDAYQAFVKQVKESDYNNLYLIADFGFDYPKNFFGYDFIDIKKGMFPFMIIAEKINDKLDDIEYYMAHTEDYIRKDSITIDSDGFSEKFTNNLKLFERFEYYIKNDAIAYLTLKTFESVNKSMDVYITGSREVKLANCEKNHKYKIEYIPITVIGEFSDKTKRTVHVY